MYVNERLIDFCNLYLAYQKASKGKKSKANVIHFSNELEKELFQLRTELRDRTYIPGTYRTFHIYDPKKRMISAAPFRDRVVHHALFNLIEHDLESHYIFDTYANRVRKGTHRAIKRCQKYIKSYPYFLKADIRKYFPSIDHEILKMKLHQKIKCTHLQWLCDLIIDASNPQEPVVNYFSGDDLFSPHIRKRGLPMGNLTSQSFANFYLSDFDHFVKQTLRLPYVRYVDDFVLFSHDRQILVEAKTQIEKFLADHLRLQLHPLKTHICPSANGITFLGQRIFTTHRLLRSQNLRRFYKRLKKRLKDYHAGLISPDELEAQLNAWLGHARQADTFRLRKKIFRHLVFEKGINVCIAPNGAWKVLEYFGPISGEANLW
jgi:RNA-directed DNA polymerase